jgi:DNA sulfur modification protein DndD
LQEYEELLINESKSGKDISDAIERILGVPILKNARAHLTQLFEAADKQAGREASRHQETQALGTALQQATEQKEAHRKELARLQGQLQQFNLEKAEAEQLLSSQQKYASILENLDAANARLEATGTETANVKGDLQRAMGDAWRSLLRDEVRSAREKAQAEAQRHLDAFVVSLRQEAVASGHCKTCDQDVPVVVRTRLAASMEEQSPIASGPLGVSGAMSRLADLSKFHEMDNAGEVRQLWRRLRTLEMERVSLGDTIVDLEDDLKESDPEALRSSKASYGDIMERISIVKRAIQDEGRVIEEKDQSIQRLRKKLEAGGTPDLRATQMRAKILRNAADVFAAAIERYKSDLRHRVEETASTLFRSMTTEKQDYANLTINESYGLTIRHQDGRAEDARSAGAEHVVALALMGALQRNAPLRGPIVMDSPFGRLDDDHTSNVIRTLPEMAPQVVLLVYEAEVGKARMRDLLGHHLLREYHLERISSRRTCVREVR